MKGKIATQRITSVTNEPIPVESYKSINVLRWNNNEWANLCPYKLKTDGNEINNNPGGVLFENWYQGSKVYEYVYPNEVYPSRFQNKNPAYLWWKFIPMNGDKDQIILEGKEAQNFVINYPNYLNWRKSVWECRNPIRYPNKFSNKHLVKFSIVIDRKNKEYRFSYLESRKKLYVAEYIRLIRKTKEYQKLLEMVNNGINLLICEIDVPAKNKKGEYGLCDENNNRIMSIKRLQKLMNDLSEPFGHGLCICLALLEDTM